MGNGEQSYERVRAQLRAFDLRLQRLEQRVGISGNGAERVPRGTAVARGIPPVSVSVRRLAPTMSQPAGATAPDMLAAFADGVKALTQLGSELARQFQPQQQPAAEGAPPAQPSGEPGAEELTWLGEETGEPPPPVVDSQNPNG